MLSKLFAIAGLTLRAAIRSRVFALLVAIVALCIAGLPFALKSDGTAPGQAQLFIHYALGLTVTLLSIAAMWSAAGAVSLEVTGRQMHALVTKPVHAAEIWLGKWLGLMAINLVMLVLAGGLMYGLLQWTTHRNFPAPEDQARLREEVLTANSLIAPEQAAAKSPSSEAKRVMLAVPPGGTESWTFRAPKNIRPGEALFLQFRFATSLIARQQPVTGLWLITADDTANPHRALGSYTPQVRHTLKLPSAKPGQLLTVTYKNVEQAAPATVLFARDTGAQLLIRESGFEGNLLRALLLALAQLAFFTALGLTAGALFSFPVAVFTALAYLFIIGLSGLIGNEPAIIADDLSPAWLAGALNAATAGIFQMANWITPPLAKFEPLNFLPTGAFIPWSLVGAAWTILGLAYGGVLAALGAWLFSRREMGLASEEIVIRR